MPCGKTRKIVIEFGGIIGQYADVEDNMPDPYLDGVFFHKAARILAMPDVRESLIAFYTFLKETFPVDGMVMHHFLPSSQSLLGLYFIHDGGIGS